jgi:hypothetical protein
VTSIAAADRALERIMHPAGGPEAFLEDHVVIVMSDHSQIAVEGRVNLAEALGSWAVLGPDGDPASAEIAVCPSQRSAQIYILDPSTRRRLLPRVVRDLRAVESLDAIAWMARRDEAAVATPRGELRFAPGGDLVDERGGSWSATGELDALGLVAEDGQVRSWSHPLALGRLWSALRCPLGGDVLVSAGSGVEFVDWGGIAHVGGGSHGALSRGDSLGTLIVSGADHSPGTYPELWTVGDITPLVLEHFTLPS